MEKYGQYRDRGSGIAPFFPIPPPPSSPLLLPWHFFLFSIRIPFLLFAWAVWLAVVRWLPPGGLLRKANLWCILGIPGVWWVDIQIDGVRRGDLAKDPSRKLLPEAGTVIASSYTGPLDVMYLAAIFDPIFTQSYAGTRRVQILSYEQAIVASFTTAGLSPPKDFQLYSLSDLVRLNANRVVVIFPETTTSNGRGILRFSPSLLSASSTTKIFSVSLRYTPADVVTPLPGWFEAVKFFWRLNSRQTHCIRVRISIPKTLSSASPGASEEVPPKNASAARKTSSVDTAVDSAASPPASPPRELPNGNSKIEAAPEKDRKIMDAVADDLARLGRVKRVDLGVEEKVRFATAWRRTRGRK